jgi:uncharacterized protein YycO
MKTIYLRYSKQKTFTSKLVSWWTGGWPSHVEFVTGPGQYLGSDIDTGVATVDDKYYSQFPLGKEEYYKIEVTESQYNLIFSFLKQQMGKKYDSWALVGNIFRRNWQVNEKWFCSELIASAFNYAGKSIINYKTNRVTPLDLLKQSIFTKCEKKDLKF